jgi:hypothetical protein
VPPLQRFAIDQSDAGSRWSQRAYLHMLLPGSPPRMRRLAVALLVVTVPLVLAVSILTGLLVVQVGAGMVVVPVHDALHLAFLIVGWLVVLRNPVNPVGWLFLATAYFGLLTDVTGQYGMYNVLGPHPDLLPAGEVLLWIGSWIWVPALGVAPLTHLVFPSGRPPSARWLWVAWVAIGSTILVMASLAVAAWSLPGPALLSGPYVGPEIYPPPRLAAVGLGLLGASLLASLVAMAVRLRRVGSPAREQIKWFLYAGVMSQVAFAVEFAFGVPVQNAATVAGFAIPIAVAIAVFRHRLYDIDRLIHRTLVYGLLTGVLGLVYAVLVLLLGPVFGGVAGDPPSWAVAGATLAVASLFRPVRHRIQETVDRHFNRRRYDAVRTVEAFTAQLRHQVDLDTLSAELLAVVGQTMEPTRVSLWLRPSRHDSTGPARGKAQPTTWAY